ncbi:antimicrobial peptide NK-lysin-like [Tachyglossus aculeatus]|uniref:antimicrobial peptide NK-lysin-like n=1 Tax=Tachyglossus aculeatus TaxID=9261 RepID=UPI0018F3A8A2|nr:antimicrobial peptide NK-lysin-like [Tachyglossus aculeatus]
MPGPLHLLLALLLLGSPGSESLAAPTFDSLHQDPASRCREARGHLPEGPGPCHLAPGLQSEEPFIKCVTCKMVVQKIVASVGEDPSPENIKEVGNKVCARLGRFLRPVCKKFIRKFLDMITQGIEEGKEAKEICVDIHLCKGSSGYNSR